MEPIAVTTVQALRIIVIFYRPNIRFIIICYCIPVHIITANAAAAAAATVIIIIIVAAAAAAIIIIVIAVVVADH